MLLLGPKFYMPILNSQISMKRLSADVKSIIKFVNPNSRDTIRALASNIITNFHHSKIFSTSVYNHLFHDAKMFLKSISNLIVTKSDKGDNVSVIMDIDSYQKYKELLSGVEVYVVLDRDPTASIERRNNEIVKELRVSGIKRMLWQ
ncbi:hypothetical protein HHI36_024327 [Cryptolaemus montrouzieri]|uniref:Uncharacterized protein n=1 Tax=Cryptolaemus montrouzieri TaxID=559131 RepID=A0ABD2NQ73_9CUCU